MLLAATTQQVFGDDHDDLASAAMRREQPRGHIGIWPEFAFLNHSCMPNAINYGTWGKPTYAIRSRKIILCA